MADEERPPDHSHNPIVRYFRILGPGLVTGASDDDPSGIATYSIAEPAPAYLFLYPAVITFPLRPAIHLVSPRAGRAHGPGRSRSSLAPALRGHPCGHSRHDHLAVPVFLAGDPGGGGGEKAREEDNRPASRRDHSRAGRCAPRRQHGHVLLEP